MVMVLKLGSFAWAVFDGQRDEKDQNNYQKRFRLDEFPSLLDFLGYMFFFPTFLIGPAFQFKDYYNFMNKKVHQSDDNKERFENAPSGVLPGIFIAFTGTNNQRINISYDTLCYQLCF